MSFLRGSVSYVWCTTSVLGKGATGSVFQVRSKCCAKLFRLTHFSISTDLLGR